VGQPGKEDVGFIAQDAQGTFPEAVYQLDDDLLGLAYSKYVVPLVAAAQDLKKRIEDLKAELAVLRGSR
jgi:hypothetical protein